MAELIESQLNDLDIALGESAQIEFISPSSRHMVKIVGYIPSRSLILTCPKVNGKSIIVRDSQVVNVRLMLNTSVSAFSSQVAKSYLDPTPHLHIAYPKFVETSVVRQAMRIETKLICALDTVKNEHSILAASNGIMIDLSAGGMKLISKEDIGSVNAKMKMAVNIKVAGYPHLLKLECEIRSQEIQMLEQVQASIVDNDFLTKMGAEYFFVYGVRFTNMTKEVAIILTAYILEKQKYNL
ncbi:flagellar brake protein [Marinomonas sp. 2405UD68-3]|uniref:flagellar brake protein n=1 Tax=Marinomonas sp. 2405UD68-3 TaxID=3391835 RepID=UPI0039C9DD3C